VFERFTDRARRVLVLAQEEARLLNHSFIGTEHILLGLIQEGDSIAARALGLLDISLVAVREKVTDTVAPPGGPPSGSPPFTPRAKKVLELALREALQLGHSYIGTEHMLLGIVREGEGVGAQVLVSLGADLDRVRQQVIQLIAGYEGGTPGHADENLPLHETANPNARLVICSFCGNGPPRSGQLVSGDNAFICERCIREWSGRLSETGPGRIRGSVVPHFQGVTATGPPPEDPEAARTEIAAAFAAHGTLSEDGRSVPAVEKGDDLGPVLVAAKERRRDIVPESADVIVSVNDIDFVDASHAAVWFSISVDGRVLLHYHRGDAVFVEGAWQVARASFCELMRMAGISCPPEE
jgi:hypothetical protein